MPWTQYSLNLEDVILRRALQGVDRGCFVDVGAFHPIYSSNTYALYERGWRGIAVDAQEGLTPLWAQYRPEDVFLSIAAGAHDGVIEFHLTSNALQMATTNAAFAEHYRSIGWETIPRRVQMASLNSILDVHLRGRELHLLTVDVEGGEYDALIGLDFVRYRPWIVVVEATVPGSPIPSHSRWEPLLIGASYEMVYFDGLNRFYLAREHQELREQFSAPPNVWDDYVSYRTVKLEEELSKEKARCQALEQRITLAQSPIRDMPSGPC